MFYPQLEFIIIIRRKNSNITNITKRNEDVSPKLYLVNSLIDIMTNVKIRFISKGNERITILALDFMNSVVSFSSNYENY